MSEFEAIALAADFLRDKYPPATDFIDAKRHTRDRYNDLYGYERYKHDFWVVQYGKALPFGVLIQNPNTYCIVIEETTNRVLEASPGCDTGCPREDENRPSANDAIEVPSAPVESLDLARELKIASNRR